MVIIIIIKTKLDLMETIMIMYFKYVYMTSMDQRQIHRMVFVNMLSFPSFDNSIRSHHNDTHAHSTHTFSFFLRSFLDYLFFKLKIFLFSLGSLPSRIQSHNGKCRRFTHIHC